MIAVITGDIIGSRKIKTSAWLSVLKEGLAVFGEHPQDWEIYRGDSFQLQVAPEKALEAILLLKAKLKQLPNLDLRASIGIGAVGYRAAQITESNGEAFIRSGECFEQAKGILGIRTPWQDFDEVFQLLLNMAVPLMDRWAPISSQIIEAKLLHPKKTQKELAKLLDTEQPLISAGLSRASFHEIAQLADYYQKEITQRCSHY